MTINGTVMDASCPGYRHRTGIPGVRCSYPGGKLPVTSVDYPIFMEGMSPAAFPGQFRISPHKGNTEILPDNYGVVYSGCCRSSPIPPEENG